MSAPLANEISTWDNITRLAKGGIDERILAVKEIIRNSTSKRKISLPGEASEVAKQLARQEQAERVRLGIARLLRTEYDHITHFLYVSLAEILRKDPSEVVREQTRIVLEENDKRPLPESKWSEIEASKRRRLMRKFAQALQSLRGRRVEAAVVLSLAAGIVTYYLTREICLQSGSLQALAQVNATILAFAFAIPFAATELSTYKPFKTTPYHFFDKRIMVFLFCYAALIFLPLALVNHPWSSALLAVSLAFALLVFPYLLWISERLTPRSILQRAQQRVVAHWGIREPDTASEIENLAYQALAQNDYEAFSLACSTMIGLHGRWMELPETVALVSGFEQTLLRLGRAAVRDQYALEIYLRSVLAIYTDSPGADKAKTFLKLEELRVLNYLVPFSRKESETTLAVVLSHMVEWAIQNGYSDSKMASQHIGWAAHLLAQQPPSIVTGVLERTREVLEGRHVLWEPLGVQERTPLWWIGRIGRGRKYTILRRLFELHAKTVAVRSGQQIQLDLKSLSVSEVLRTDAEELLNLQKLSHEDKALAYDDYMISPMTDSLEDMTEEMNRKVILKASTGNMIVGAIRGYRIDSSCRVERLCINPRYRHKGIGKRLLVELESRFPSLEYQVVIGERCKEAITFFERQGFVRYDLQQLSDNVAVVYLKKVNPPIVAGKSQTRRPRTRARQRR
jgi:N-acetylglutamate synthase-like GNAT family acetyltransferase